MLVLQEELVPKLVEAVQALHGSNIFALVATYSSGKHVLLIVFYSRFCKVVGRPSGDESTRVDVGLPEGSRKQLNS